MAIFNLNELLEQYSSDDDSSVDTTTSIAPPVSDEESCFFLDYSIDGDIFISEDYLSSDNESTVLSPEELSIDDTWDDDTWDDDHIDDDGNSNDDSTKELDEVPLPPPLPVLPILVTAPPLRRSSRPKRKPVRFADEYHKYYCS